MPNKTLLTIAGFDPSSGAGVTADLMVFAAHEFFGTSCITALTVQNTLVVRATQAIAPPTISATLDCLYDDLPPVGVKIGMLGTADAVSAVAAFLTRIRQRSPVLVVFDPVLKSSSGKDLLDPAAHETLRKELLPAVDWITPNHDELHTLTGISDPTEAAHQLQRLGRELTVVVTGGHLDPPVDLLLEPGSSQVLIEGKHVVTSSTHGTGCAFSSALLCQLVLGSGPLEAVRSAKHYVSEALRTAIPIGTGHGPVSHLWPLHTKASQSC